MDNACQVPGLVALHKDQTQAAPIHAAILRIETGEVEFDDHRTGVELLGIIERIAEAVTRLRRSKGNV